MSGTPKKPPGGIAVSAWLWIASAALMLLGSLTGGAGYFTMPGMFGGFASHPPPGFEWMSVFFRHVGLLLAIQFALGAIALWSGIALLRLKAWARIAIEILCWISVAYFLASGALFIRLCLSLSQQLLPGAPPALVPLLQLAGICTGILITALFIMPMAIMIRYLRSGEARNAVASSK